MRTGWKGVWLGAVTPGVRTVTCLDVGEPREATLLGPRDCPLRGLVTLVPLPSGELGAGLGKSEPCAHAPTFAFSLESQFFSSLLVL